MNASRIAVDDVKGFAWVDARTLQHFDAMLEASRTALQGLGRDDGRKGYLRPVLTETDLR